MTIPKDSMALRNDAIIFTDLDDTVVMMDPDAGSYYELDPVGTRIWALLAGARPVADLCVALLAEYEVDSETFRGDLEAFLEEASALGIIRLEPAAGRPDTD